MFHFYPSFCLLIVAFLTSWLSPLCAEEWVKTYALEAYLGPEIYGVSRSKEGGAKQSGVLYGVRLGFDHVCRYKWYWGVDFLFAQGTLEGKASGDKIKSMMSDLNAEARLGYTFQSKHFRCLSFTPYTGVGFFSEKNYFEHPTPLPLHFKNEFFYIPMGFLSQVFLSPHWSVGFNAKLRFLVLSQVRASNDPDHDATYQNYEEKLQYRLELPVTYFDNWRGVSFGVTFEPFYEVRPYGHLPNFPFDFLETEFRLYGAALKLLYLF